MATTKSDGDLLEAKRNEYLKQSRWLADDKQAAWEFGSAIAVFFFSAGVMATMQDNSLIVWSATFLMSTACDRLFVILHDMGHLSFFSTPEKNRFWGRLASVFVLTPYLSWQKGHNYHHHVFGALDIVDTGQTIFFTKQQYENFPWWKRLGWRIAREPIVFFLLVPLLKWFFVYPIVRGDIFTVISMVFYFVLYQFIGYRVLLVIWMSGLVGLILFHLQHSVNTGYRSMTSDKLDRHRAAFEGSTHLPIPFPLTWMTMGIEFHHIHHATTRIPGYKLAQCHYQAPPGMWKGVTKPSLKDMLEAMTFVMWDDATRRFRPFWPLDQCL